MRNKLLFMQRGGEVVRFHTLRTIQQDNVAQHSFGVAWLCHLLTEGHCSKSLILGALAHDLAEHQVGDMPAPTKRELGVSLQMARLEDEILHGAGFSFALTEEELRIMKLADCFQGMLFCARERSLGNRGVEVVFGRYRSYVEEKIKMRGIEQEVLSTVDSLWEAAKHGEF